jgi:hypothetical protein
MAVILPFEAFSNRDIFSADSKNSGDNSKSSEAPTKSAIVDVNSTTVPE